MKRNRKIKIGSFILLLIYAFYLAVHGIDQDSYLANLIRIFSSTNHFLLLLYALAFVLVFMAYQRHKKTFDTGSFLYLIYAAGGIGGCWYYSQEKRDLFYPNIYIEALIFLFVTINICLYPLWKADFTKLKKIDDNGMEDIYNLLSVFFAVISILPLLSLLSHFSFGLLVGSNLASMYESGIDKSALFFHGPSKICFALLRRFEMVIVVLLFYQLSKNKKNLACGLLLPMIVFVMFKLLSGSRGGLVGTALLLTTLFLMLRQTLQKKIRRMIVRVGSIAGAIFVLCLAAISVSRYSYNGSKTETIDVWISQYLGESLPRFSDDVWNIGITMDGNQNFIFIRKILGLPYIANYEMFKISYLAKLGTPVDVFYTFMGDIYLDFGMIGSVIFALLFAFVFSRMLKIKEKITIPNLITLSVVFNFFGFGFAANVYRMISIQEDTMWLLLLALSLFVLERTKRANKITPPEFELINHVRIVYNQIASHPYGQAQYKLCAL